MNSLKSVKLLQLNFICDVKIAAKNLMLGKAKKKRFL